MYYQCNTYVTSIISHDVFLETLSRVINLFITRDKALRGTLCNSTPACFCKNTGFAELTLSRKSSNKFGFSLDFP